MGAPSTVDEYLSHVPPKERAALKRMRTIIRKAAPQAREYIGYGMPCYAQDGPVACFAAFKGHLSFFGASSTVFQKFPEARRFVVSKGTMHFTADDPIPAALVRKIVQLRVRENAAAKAVREKKRKAR